MEISFYLVIRLVIRLVMTCYVKSFVIRCIFYITYVKIVSQREREMGRRCRHLWDAVGSDALHAASRGNLARSSVRCLEEKKKKNMK